MHSENFKTILEHSLSKDKWKHIGFKRRAGIVAPLFSLYSKNSIGIGELVDLKLLVDWCVKTGNSIIQLLPMNETGAVNCAYDAVSSFALDPAYISLRLVPGAEKFSKQINSLKKNLPAGKPYVNYQIKGDKLHILWEIFSNSNACSSKEYKAYLRKNEYWIYDYGLYKVLKYYEQGQPWYNWQENLREHDQGVIEKFACEHEDEIYFQIWVQWLLYQQFQDVRDYANQNKILIKGDLPVLVSRDSADVWAHQDFFKLHLVAGAPPDMYCAKGQRWGMPTYNWHNIEQDNFLYLTQKLNYAENFYDILRIDHVVGLFRIWSIPCDDALENQGLHGFFDPKDEHLWEEHGKKILTVMVKNTKMLLCAEDLGVIPKACPRILKEMGILGNEVQRWTKDWTHRHNFFLPEEYRMLSVAMLSTHDTTNWADWWENEAGTIDQELFQRKCNDRGINFEAVKHHLFDLRSSRYGRLRWSEHIVNEDILAHTLAKPKEHIRDFIEMYQNTYNEKQKLWDYCGLPGKALEPANERISGAALKITMSSAAILAIELITDWLIFAGIIKKDFHHYRINVPGTVSPQNWSLTMPVCLEDLVKHKSTIKTKNLIKESKRNRD